MDAQFNPDKQHTLKQAVNISGTGLHTGVVVDMTFVLLILVTDSSSSVLIWPEDL
jgi:hypothetical protein